MVKSTFVEFSIIVGLHFFVYGAYLTYNYIIDYNTYKHLNSIQMEKIETIEGNEELSSKTEELSNKELSSKTEELSNKELSSKTEELSSKTEELSNKELFKKDELYSHKCIDDYKIVLEKKQQMLSILITQLDTISSDILIIKEKLENLNHSSSKSI
jgi:hypothetical protein